MNIKNYPNTSFSHNMLAPFHHSSTTTTNKDNMTNFFPDEIKNVDFERHQKAFLYEISNRIAQSRDKQKWCQKV